MVFRETMDKNLGYDFSWQAPESQYKLLVQSNGLVDLVLLFDELSVNTVDTPSNCCWRLAIMAVILWSSSSMAGWLAGGNLAREYGVSRSGILSL
jgi:hypothetical protein